MLVFVKVETAKPRKTYDKTAPNVTDPMIEPVKTLLNLMIEPVKTVHLFHG